MQKLQVVIIALMFTLALSLPTGLGIDVLLDVKIGYRGSVLVNSATLTEVVIYTRTFTTVKNYPMTDIKIAIPFTGNKLIYRRSRIIVYLDREPIYDATMYSSKAWDLKPLNIVASKVNMLTGNHVIKIFAAVDGGVLNIPHYNAGLYESTILPKIFGRMTVLGHK